MNKPFCKYCRKPILWPIRSRNHPFRISFNEYLRRKFCDNKCRGLYTSKHIMGNNNPNFKGGKTKCIDCNKNLAQRYTQRNTIRCRPCWFNFLRKNPSQHPNWKGGAPKCQICKGKTGDWHSKICRKCYKGKNHRLWRGGTSKRSQRIRALPKYRKWYMSVFQRDNFTCVHCGENGNHKANNLCADHIKQFALILKENKITSIEKAKVCNELWDISNGRTLCRPCHRLTDSFAKKL